MESREKGLACATCGGRGSVSGLSCTDCEILLDNSAMPDFIKDNPVTLQPRKLAETEVCDICGKNLRHYAHLPSCTSKKLMKFDGDKPRADLLPAVATLEICRVLGYGARKYSAHNWRQCADPTRYTAAAMRHILAILSGERVDPETGYTHAAHAAACLMFVHELDQAKVDTSTQA